MTESESRKLRLDKGAILRFFMTIFLSAAVLTFIIVILDARSWGPGPHLFDYGLLALYTLLGFIQLSAYLRTKNNIFLGLGFAMLLFIPYMIIGFSEYSGHRLVLKLGR